MNTAPPSIDDLTDEMIESAVAWRLRMDGADWTAADEAELETWLQADERHPLALGCSGQVWSFFDQHATSPELLGAHRALLGRVERQARGRWTGPAAVLRMPGRRMAAGFMAAAVLCGAAVWPLATQGQVYQSDVGERRVVILKDGSVLSLDAMSRVTVRYTKGARRLKLERGQARFDVAHDPSRPFTVAVRDQSVVATGTAFNIDMTEPEVRVTLIQGRVLVLSKAKALRLGPQPRSSKPVELHAGQVLVTPPDAPAPHVQTADIEQVMAWQQGKLDFENEPLGEAVEKVNRYTDRKIKVADTRAAAVRVSGAFDAGDVNAFIGAVTGFLPVRAIEGRDGVILTFAGPEA
jgi:transmembrane sensor